MCSLILKFYKIIKTEIIVYTDCSFGLLQILVGTPEKDKINARNSKVNSAVSKEVETRELFTQFSFAYVCKATPR